MRDPDRKGIFTIIYEFFYLFVIYRELPVHYFSRFLFKKHMVNIKNHLPNKFLGDRISVRLNDQVEKQVLDNKLYFDFYYRQFITSIPKIIMYNYKDLFVYGSKNIDIKSSADFKVLLEEVFQQNPGYDSVFIKKTNSSSGGFDTFKLFRGETESHPLLINNIYSKIILSGFLFQETVNQNKELNRLNPSCLNTIRMDSFTDNDGIHLISAYIRMSIKNKYIDNISSGGCQVGIDLESGRLLKYGYAPIRTNGVKVYTEHPLTGVVFEGFEIPFFDEAKKTVIEAASYLPGLRIVGWDVAIGETGPILIEGNSDYDITGNDLSSGGYLAHPVFRKVLREIKYLKS